MIPYLSFYAIIATLLLCARHAGKYKAKYILFVIFAVLVLFAGLRGIVGSDTQSYIRVYNELADTDGIMTALYTMEPGFIALLAFHKAVFNSESLYILMMSAFQAFLLYTVAKTSSKKYIFLLCYVLLFYLNFHFNITRSAIATMLFLYGLTGRSIAFRRFALILAPFFHMTILPFYLLFFTQLKLKQILTTLAVILLLIAINFSTISAFSEKYVQYATFGDWTTSDVTLLSVVLSMTAMTSIFYFKHTSYNFRWMTSFLILSYVLTYFYPIVFRYTITASIFYYYYLIEELTGKKQLASLLFLWAPILLSFYFTLTAINNETINLIKMINSGNPVNSALDSTYIPYKFMWNDQRIRN